MANLLFSDLKVIELASVLAGPRVGSFFAEHGAKVIKVENPSTSGDMTRSWRLATEDPHSPVSAYYASANYGKETAWIDLKTDSGKKEIMNLLASADLVIANFKSGAAQKFGLDYEELKTQFPQLIYANITGFGEDYHRAAYDIVLQAESGFLSMNGYPGKAPVRMPVALIDIMAAHQLKEGILSALYHRQKVGEGQKISVSLWETALSSLANQASNWLMEQHLPGPQGSLHPNIAPYGEIVYSKDNKMLILAIGTDRQFSTMCSLLDIPEVAESDRFKTNHARVQNREALLEVLLPQFKRKLREDWLQELIQHHVPAGAVRNLQEVFSLPEARNLVLSETLEGKETLRVKSSIFHSSLDKQENA